MIGRLGSRREGASVAQFLWFFVNSLGGIRMNHTQTFSIEPFLFELVMGEWQESMIKD